MKKRFLILVLVVVLALSLGASAVYANIALFIDGARQNPTVAPVVQDGVTLVPLRLISETLGADVSWNAGTRQATITTAGYNVVFTIDSQSFTVNGATRSLVSPARLINNSTMVPIRAFAESIGATVNFNEATNTATVDYFTTMTGTLNISGSTTVQPIVQGAADKIMGMNRGLNITVAGGGSGTGIRDASAGTVHIGMSSREFTAEERSALNIYAVALEGIAIIAHPSNPVQNLTVEQAAEIFLGGNRNWNAVGGNNAPILVTTRETGSGTRATFEELLLNRESVIESAAPFGSSALIMQAVAREANAVGYVSMGYLDSTVKAVTLDGVAATAATVVDASYALGRNLYVCTSGRPTGVAAIFIDYLRSADVQRNIVVQEGYIQLR